MESLFAAVNAFFEFLVPITNFLWEYPTHEASWATIPVLGRLSLVMLMLLGAGLFFTLKTRFVQLRYFTRGVHIMLHKKSSSAGISPLAAFLLSSAMRIGPGNIMGVTGAISVGGPGALFWMWVSALLGMATAFTEAVLAQLYKRKEHGSYVGGLPFYGQALLNNRAWVGISLSLIFIVYALFSIPGQTFHLFTALGAMTEALNGTHYERSSTLYQGIALLLILCVAVSVWGGLRRVSKITDIMVPIMAGLYTLIVLCLILLNVDLLPHFFKEVFHGAFSPHALFGGAIGHALVQGVKRGLMSNEAGQGTITMAAAVSENDHPCEQGFIQAIGVFLDTMIICTMTGFVVVMAQLWAPDSGVDWNSIQASKITVFLSSVRHLIPFPALHTAATVTMALCYALFAFTTLVGLILFAEIAANRISSQRFFLQSIRAAGAFFFVPFGALSVLAGLELGNLWVISDFVNVMVVIANLPLLMLGAKHVFLALEHYQNNEGVRFISDEIGLETEVWVKPSTISDRAV